MYQKITDNGYIVSIVKGTTEGNITEEEYNEIKTVIENRPVAREGFDYRLKENLEWEEYEPPTKEEEND